MFHFLGDEEFLASLTVRTRNGLFPTDTLPKILYHISDELCDTPQVWEAYKSFHLVFRNYACSKQYAELYRVHKNVVVIPLPYVRGMLDGRSSLETIREQHVEMRQQRNYTWAFAGNLKTNRCEMLETFRDVRPYQNMSYSKRLNHTMLAPPELYSLYGSVHFVLSGKGANLDCLRHTEATIAGAIPVIQASEEEIWESFGRYGEIPPWVFGATWFEAKDRIVSLLSESPDKIIERRLGMLRWWQNEMRRSQEAFCKALSLSKAK